MPTTSVTPSPAASPRSGLAIWQRVMGGGMAGGLLTAGAFVAKDLGAWVGFSRLDAAGSYVGLQSGMMMNYLVIAAVGLIVVALVAGLVSMLARNHAETFDRNLVLWAPAMVLLASLI